MARVALRSPPLSTQADLQLEDAPPVGAPQQSAAPKPFRPVHISGYAREGRDFYATPDWVTEVLLDRIPLRGPIWEPCCGDGAMSRVLAARGHQVTSTDIADRGFGTPGVDFLRCGRTRPGCRAIVTNPPYGETGTRNPPTKSAVAMLTFLRHALALVAPLNGQLALLVRLQWMAGKRAASLLSSGPFAATIILTRRIQWFDQGALTNSGQHHHAWIVFDHAHPRDQPPALLYA